MKGDFSRETFDAGARYAGVLLQRGRTLLDADYNEQNAIERQRSRRLARDLIGPHGGPADCLGFGCITSRRGYLDWLARDAPAAVDAAARIAPDVDWRRDVLITPGRYYIDGVPVENGGIVSYSGHAALAGHRALPDAAGALVVHLEAWERVVTALDDPRLLDPALGEADTTVRVQRAWRLFMAPAAEPGPCELSASLGRCGLMAARARAGAGYTGSENRLYRIEIHAGADAGMPTLKWSRDNGATVRAVRRPIASSANDLLALDLAPASGAAESATGIEPGQWVELLPAFDPGPHLQGPVLRVANARSDGNSVTLDTAGLAIEPQRVRVIRRWHQPAASIAVPSDGAWIAIEDGIEIRFDPASAGDLRAGDYWVIPARATVAAIDWPSSEDEGGGAAIPLDRRPNGPWRARAVIGVLRRKTRSGAWSFEDRRRRFAALAK